MEEYGAADEAAAILMMSHAPKHIQPSFGGANTSKSNRIGTNSTTTVSREAPRRSSEAKANAAALKASRSRANAIRRKAAEDIDASRRKEERLRSNASSALAPEVVPANSSHDATAKPSANSDAINELAEGKNDSEHSVVHEPIQSPAAIPSSQDAAALSLVKRLRMEAKERARRKAMAAAAESEAIRIEMEQLDAIKARREAAEESKKAAAAAARADRAARRRAEVQARLTKLGGARKPAKNDPQHTPVHGGHALQHMQDGAQSKAQPTDIQPTSARAKKWQWRPPAPVLPSGDPNASLAVAGMQVSGVSQALLAQAAAVDSAVPALQQRKASLAQLRANFDGASAAVSTPGSYYAPQYFDSGLGSARSGPFSQGLGATSPSTSRTGSPDMFQMGDGPLPHSSSPHLSATPRLRQAFRHQPTEAFSNPAAPRSQASSRGSARSTASTRLSPLGQRPDPDQRWTASANPPTKHTSSLLSAASAEDASQAALGAADTLVQTAQAVNQALLADSKIESRKSLLTGKARLPNFSRVQHGSSQQQTSAVPAQSLGPMLGTRDSPRPNSSSKAIPALLAPKQPVETLGASGDVLGWDSKDDDAAHEMMDSLTSESPAFSPKASTASASPPTQTIAKITDHDEVPASQSEVHVTGPTVQQPADKEPQLHTRVDAKSPALPTSTQEVHQLHSKQFNGDDGRRSNARGATDSKHSDAQRERIHYPAPADDSTKLHEPGSSKMQHTDEVTSIETARAMRLARLQERLPATPPGGRSRRKQQCQDQQVAKPVDLSQTEVKHLSDRMQGNIAVAAGGAKPGPGLNRLYAAAADLDDESDEEDITPETVARQLQADKSHVKSALNDEQQAERALEIARNADFLKVLAGKKKKLASWNHAGEQQEPVQAFSGQGHSLSQPSSSVAASVQPSQAANSSSVREARLAALARRGL